MAAARRSSPELVALMLADARLPTGGHTQSGGLEAAVRAGLSDDGRTLHEIEDYARGRLRTVVRVETATAVVVRGTILEGGDAMAVIPHWAARTPSRALRAASGRMGRGYLRLAERIWPETLHHLPRDAEIPRAIVLGVIGAVTQLSAEDVARVGAYEDAQTVLAAALKLLPLDPAVTAEWMVNLHADIDDCVDSVSHVAVPEGIPACGAPLVDQYAERHVTESWRLFHA